LQTLAAISLYVDDVDNKALTNAGAVI